MTISCQNVTVVTSLKIVTIPSGALIYVAPAGQTPLPTGISTPTPITGLAVGSYDIRVEMSGYQDFTFGNAQVTADAETVININLTLSATPAHITATSIIVTPRTSPCIQGSCIVDVTVIWTNSGETAGPITPNISIDGTPVTPAPFPEVSLGPSPATLTRAFEVYGLTVAGSPHSICPIPNT